MSEEDKKSRPLLYILLFIFSFIFFMYVTFPYGVLKEAMTAQIQAGTGYQVTIRDFGPSLPIGFEAQDINISSSTNQTAIGLKKLTVNVSALSLLIGRIAVEVSLEDKKSGELEVFARWGILQLALDQNFIPQIVELEAENFELGGFVTFGLNEYSVSAHDLIKGSLEKIKMDGSLDGRLDMDLAVNDPLQSSGKVDLKIIKGNLDFNDDALDVPKQIFKKAVLQASLAKGALKVSNQSGFHTQELTININGESELRNPFPKSKLKIGIDVALAGKLKENFDILLPVFGGKDGSLNLSIGGTMDRPSFATN